MSRPVPVEVAIMEQVAQRLARVPSMQGADYDAPFDPLRDAAQLPWTQCFELREEYNAWTAGTELFGQHMTIRLFCLFGFREEPGQTPRRLGRAIKAQIEQALLADVTLGGLTFDLIPLEAAIQDPIVAEGGVVTGRAAVWFDWRADYARPRNNPYDPTQ